MPDIFVASHKKTVPHKEPEDKTSPKKKESRFKAFLNHDYSKITFQHQKQNETIIFLLRRHFITNLWWILVSIFLIVIFPLLTFISGTFDNFFSFLSPQVGIFFTFFYFLFIFSYIFINILDWFYNITLVTNIGVVDIDYSNIVYHDVAVTNLNLIEDVNYTKVGFIRSLFNYGDLFVQTAGGKENLEALRVPDPEKPAKFIADNIGEGGTSG